MTDDAVVTVTTTVPDADTGASIARDLVENRLAACVQIVGPLRSIYRWKDRIQDDEEFLLILKSTAHLVSAIELRLADTHPYEVPELIATPIHSGGKAYLSWVRESLTDGG